MNRSSQFSIVGPILAMLAGCHGGDSDPSPELVGEVASPTHTVAPHNQGVSDTNTLGGSSINPSVAVTDGNNTEMVSDAAISFERDGLTYVSTATLNGQGEAGIWTEQSSDTWPMPATPSLASDGAPFNAYEGNGTILAFHSTHGPAELRDHVFVYTGKAGSEAHGTHGAFGGESTDVVAIVSDDAGVTFGAAVVLTEPVESPHRRLAIDSVVSTVQMDPLNGASTPRFWTLWRQHQVTANDTLVEPKWMLRCANVRVSELGSDIVPCKRTYVLNSEDWDHIPVDAGPPNLVVHETEYSHEAGELEGEDGGAPGGVGGVTIVYPTHDPKKDTCPTTDLFHVEWHALSWHNGWTTELVGMDAAWRPCVGPDVKHPLRPALTSNAAAGMIYGAITGGSPTDPTTKVYVIRKAIGTPGWQNVTPPEEALSGHDQWAPAISLYHYPTDPTDKYDIGLLWYDTRYDSWSPKGNTFVDILGKTYRHVSSGNATWNNPVTLNTVHGQEVEAPLGDYNAIGAMPHVSTGFLGAWGDQRSSDDTEVWGASFLHN